MKGRLFLAGLMAIFFLPGCSSSEKTTVARRANQEGKTLSNPVPATPASLNSGRKLFEKLCVECHGEKGDGVSIIAAAMPAGELKPSNLTDDHWDRGSTDGEIFVVIRDGSGGSAPMKGLNGRPGVGPTEMWNLVNYIRSLKGAPATEN